jgi:hypothetical protein
MCFDGLAKTSAEAIPAVGSWDELLTWVTTELKGKQRRVMELVIAAHGECSLADLAIDKEISWEYPFDNEFNQIRRPLNAKLKRAGKTWKLCRHDNKGQLIRIGQK